MPVLLAYGGFGLCVIGTVVWNLIVRPSSTTIAMQIRLLPILALALTVRLVAANLPGHDFDLSINKGWAQSAVQLGLAHSYHEQLNGNVLPNYPPLIITLYWLTGTLYQFASTLFHSLPADYNIVIRFPAIIADLVACVVIAIIVRKAGLPQGWTLAALVYALHPVVIHDTSVWGQTDSIYALWMLLALYALSSGRWFYVGLWTAGALLTKPQAAAILPVLLIVLVRHLPRSVWFFGGTVLGGALILPPFVAGGALDAVLAVYHRTIGGYYNGVSIGAYNFWAIFHRTARLSDDEIALGLISFRSAGLVLLAAATTLVLWRLRMSLIFPRNERQHLIGVLLAGALTTSAMFLFATEMHERYQFAYVLLALPVAAVSGAGAILYAATSCLIFVNFLAALGFGPVDIALFDRVPHLPKVAAVLQLVLFFLTVGMAPKLADVTNFRRNSRLS